MKHVILIFIVLVACALVFEFSPADGESTRKLPLEPRLEWLGCSCNGATRGLNDQGMILYEMYIASLKDTILNGNCNQ